MLNNYEDAFIWYQENAHRIDRFEFAEEDGTRRPLTNTEMYWLTKIKQAEDDGVDVPTDPQAQLEQALQENATLRGLLREACECIPDTADGWAENWIKRVEAALEGKP